MGKETLIFPEILNSSYFSNISLAQWMDNMPKENHSERFESAGCVYPQL